MVTELDDATQERLAEVLETRGADPEQQAMRQRFLADITMPTTARVLDVGCGTGVLTRVLARHEAVDAVVGVDVAPSLLQKARDLAAHLPNIEFREADARSLPFPAETFDVAVLDSTLSHVPDPAGALAEIYRVLRPSGCVAAFDGDYATATVALGNHDPLQVCVDAMMANSVNDRRVMRRLPRLVRTSGFEAVQTRGHGFVEFSDGRYMLTVIDRGADMLRGAGLIGEDLATALKAEALRRVAASEFFGHIAYVSVIARQSA